MFVVMEKADVYTLPRPEPRRQARSQDQHAERGEFSRWTMFIQVMTEE